MFDSGLEYCIADDYWVAYLENAAEALAEDGILVEKDYWIIDNLDGCEQFTFFYFDEGEDPPVYSFTSSGYPGAGIRRRSWTSLNISTAASSCNYIPA